MSYQFIVINACEKRKQTMITLFKQLNVQDDLIYYLEAFTPDNSAEYLYDSSFLNQNIQKVICCTKSHCSAFEYAAKDDSTDYSIILEDDVAFHKTDFLKVVEKIISNWDEHFTHCSYISLGWIPCNNYNHYNSKENIKIQDISNINEKWKFLNDFLNVGLQCYIVKKNKIKQIAELLNKPTFNIFKESLSNFISSIHGPNFTGYSPEAIDCILNRIMTYTMIFPPLVIEQKNVVSLLGHENAEHYWDRFFKGYENEIENYMTY